MALLRAIKLHDTMDQNENICLVLLVLGPRPTPRPHGGLPLCHFLHIFHTDLGQPSNILQHNPLLLFNR